MRRILLYGFTLVVLAGIALAIWLLQLNAQIQSRLENGWFLAPVEIYSAPIKVRLGEKLALPRLIDRLKLQQYRERGEGDIIHERDFAILDLEQCEGLLNSPFTGAAQKCFLLKTPTQDFGPFRQSETFLIALDDQDRVQNIWSGENPWVERVIAEFQPELFAQFYDNKPILRRFIKMGEVPLQCSQAITATEDNKFLEHKGVSWTGLSRAILMTLIKGWGSQGGSTITQQLVKNYFLTSEKTFKRKFVELFMAILLEHKVDKDVILENYLNITYMGQNGPFQIVGFGAASDYYFTKPLSDLNLSECALLAAIVNSPGLYNPFTKPENALKRRTLVLERMVQNGMITEDEAKAAQSVPLPKPQRKGLSEPAPYFVQAVFRFLNENNISVDSGLRIFTTLDVEAQELAQRAVASHVANLEKNNKNIAKLKAESKKNIEAAFIAVDLDTGGISALVGGRRYVQTQYNRILDGHRQVGSVMKPFVYLAAFEGRQPDGSPYLPTTLIEDSPFTYSYEGQKWSPRNYTREHYGPVPLFYALKNSLNLATAKLGLEVGLDNIIDVARRAGVTSTMKAYPSLTLGAFEIRAYEVAQAYATIARFGLRRALHSVTLVENLEGDEIFTFNSEPEAEISPTAAAVLVGMMKENLTTGTGRLASLRGFSRPAAGKTGTTSDAKDSWYAGFTPSTLAVAWTGYDDNTPSGLTGASGALPLWIEFMKPYTEREPEGDFAWPEGTEVKRFSADEIRRMLPPNANDYEIKDTELIFAN